VRTLTYQFTDPHAAGKRAMVPGRDESHLNRYVRGPVQFHGDQSSDLEDMVPTYCPDIDEGPASERKDLQVYPVLSQGGYGTDFLHHVKAVKLRRRVVVCLTCVSGGDKMCLHGLIPPV
jgi:hypothetical protein